VLGWQSHYDTFDNAGQCLFGSVYLQDEPWLGFNVSRAINQPVEGQCHHFTCWIYVTDVDAVYNRVSAAGWSVESPPENQFWGERLFRMRDLNGIQLIFSQKVEDIDLDEIRARHQKLREEQNRDWPHFTCSDSSLTSGLPVIRARSHKSISFVTLTIEFRLDTHYNRVAVSLPLLSQPARARKI
jgi:hypothetical protein